MNRRGVGRTAVVLGGAAIALLVSGAAAQANPDVVGPLPFFSEFPDFTGTTTGFAIPDVFDDEQGPMDIIPFGASIGSPVPGTGYEFTSALGIQNLNWVPVEPAGDFADTDEFQLTLPGVMGSTSDALFENDLQFASGGGFIDTIGSPEAGYAMTTLLSTVASRTPLLHAVRRLRHLVRRHAAIPDRVASYRTRIDFLRAITGQSAASLRRSATAEGYGA